MPPNFAFVPGMPPVSPPSTSRKSSSPALINNKLTTVNIEPQGNQMLNKLSQAKGMYDALPPQGKQAVNDAVSSVANNIFKSNGTGDSPNSSGYSLTNAPNPKNIQLDSGIKPNTYTSDYLDSLENVCSPLHLTHCVVKIPTVNTLQLYKYFTGVSAFDIQTKAQVNVSFNIDTTTQLSATAILTAINTVSKALQVYFYYASIVSYHSNPVNKNNGMIYIRSQMTPAMIESLVQLGRILSDTPFPPRFLELIRYLSGNFMSGNTAEAPIIKISPLEPNELGVDASAITQCLTDLDVASTKLTLTVLRKAIPQWSPKVLYDVDPIPTFDKNFMTLFQNLPFTYYGSATYSKAPLVTSDTNPIKYNTYTSELDGVAFALTGIWSNTQNLWLPTIMIPTGQSGAITGNSRVSFYTISGVTKFWPSDLNSFLTRSRNATYQINDAITAVITPHVLGTNMCQAVTADTIRETCMNVIDYLMSADTIKMDVKKFHFGSSSSKPRNTRRPSKK